jgi:hypothetical protein
MTRPGAVLAVALAWSFNRDGEALPGMISARDERLGVSTSETREQRRELAPLAKPQQGVDPIAADSSEAEGAPEGVRAKEEGAAR